MDYFNYFTEVEERFRAARGTGLFLFSPLDWALLESWKESSVPLEAALKGVDRAFEKWHKRKRKFRQVNSLAYCAQEVMEAAREMAEGDTRGAGSEPAAPTGFEAERIAAFLAENALAARRAAERLPPGPAATLAETAESLERLAEAARAGDLGDLEAAEQRLTVLEERALAALSQGLGEDELVAIRQAMESQLAPYRSKMKAAEIVVLEKQYRQRAMFEAAGLPRFSLYYLR